MSIVVYYDVISKKAISDEKRDCPSPEMLSITPPQEILIDTSEVPRARFCVINLVTRATQFG